jgi:hypothetical protein
MKKTMIFVSIAFSLISTNSFAFTREDQLKTLDQLLKIQDHPKQKNNKTLQIYIDSLLRTLSGESNPSLIPNHLHKQDYERTLRRTLRFQEINRNNPVLEVLTDALLKTLESTSKKSPPSAPVQVAQKSTRKKQNYFSNPANYIQNEADFQAFVASTKDNSTVCIRPTPLVLEQNQSNQVIQIAELAASTARLRRPLPPIPVNLSNRPLPPIPANPSDRPLPPVPVDIYDTLPLPPLPKEASPAIEVITSPSSVIGHSTHDEDANQLLAGKLHERRKAMATDEDENEVDDFEWMNPSFKINPAVSKVIPLDPAAQPAPSIQTQMGSPMKNVLHDIRNGEIRLKHVEQKHTKPEAVTPFSGSKVDRMLKQVHDMQNEEDSENQDWND